MFYWEGEFSGVKGRCKGTGKWIESRRMMWKTHRINKKKVKKNTNTTFPQCLDGNLLWMLEFLCKKCSRPLLSIQLIVLTCSCIWFEPPWQSSCPIFESFSVMHWIWWLEWDCWQCGEWMIWGCWMTWWWHWIWGQHS